MHKSVMTILSIVLVLVGGIYLVSTQDVRHTNSNQIAVITATATPTCRRVGGIIQCYIPPTSTGTVTRTLTPTITSTPTGTATPTLQFETPAPPNATATETATFSLETPTAP